MRSIKDLEEEIFSLRFSLESEKDEDRLKKGKRDLEFKEEIVSYLKSGVTEDFIRSEIDRLSNRLTLIKQGYEYWLPPVKYASEEAKIKAYNKEMGAPKVKTQLKALRYIFNNK